MLTVPGKVIATSGEITSENHPNNYPDNVDKKYFINAPTGHMITFKFLFFDIEVGKQKYIIGWQTNYYKDGNS